jgi:glycosyltransferase involved in cell wall biosynthesis
LIEGSLGLINTVADEDFGIVPIEVMAHGKPVLAHRSGGHLEIIKENVSGMFFDEINFEQLVSKIKEFDQAVRNNKFSAGEIRLSVEKYSKERFQTEFKKFVDEKLEQRGKH